MLLLSGKLLLSLSLLLGCGRLEQLSLSLGEDIKCRCSCGAVLGEDHGLLRGSSRLFLEDRHSVIVLT